jgi:hypothetical protein
VKACFVDSALTPLGEPSGPRRPGGCLMPLFACISAAMALGTANSVNIFDAKVYPPGESGGTSKPKSTNF